MYSVQSIDFYMYSAGRLAGWEMIYVFVVCVYFVYNEDGMKIEVENENENEKWRDSLSMWDDIWILDW